MNTWFRSLLMQGAGEEPASGWEYADYIHPKTTSSNGIVLSYRFSNTGTFEVDFKIPTSITTNDNIFLINNKSFYIKAYYSSNKLVINIVNNLISYNTSYTSPITDDGTLVHKLTIKDGYVWLDKVKCTSTQIVPDTQAARPKIAYNFTSDCRIYNIYYYDTAETHAHMVFSKSKGFETPYSCMKSSQDADTVVISSADEWVGNFDYEPAYVSYIKPVNEPYKLLNLHIDSYPKHKIACEVSTTSGSIFYGGFYVEYDDYYESGYYDLTGGNNSSVIFSQSPYKYTFKSVNADTKFTFDNFSGTPKMNGATGTAKSIGYDRDWEEDDEEVIQRVDSIYYGTKVYSFKIQVNGSGTIYDCLPAKPHYNVAWDNIDGYLIDKNTGFVFTPVCDTSTVDKQRVYFFSNPVDDPTIPFYIENVSDTTNNIYISMHDSNYANFSILYSTNNVNWNTATWSKDSSGTTIGFLKYYKIITLPVGGRVYFKSVNSTAYLTSPSSSSSRYTPNFASTGNIVAGGNLSSLNNQNFTDSTTYVAASSSYLFEPNNTGANYLQDVKKMYICINGNTNLNFLFYSCANIDTVFISKHLNSGWGTTSSFITNSKAGTIYFPTGMSIPTGNNGISSTWTKKNL